ncbi:GTP-binding protein, partial [Nocardia cyriacigeorgica]
MVDRANGVGRPEAIRNVVLVGGSGSGKTTLVEALALATGSVNRAGRVEDGTSLSDYDEIEQRQHRSVQLSVVPVQWEGVKINLIDTPGYADFVGELRAGLRAADAALFVVSAAEGVEGVAGSTRALWEECASVGMPRAIVLTHLDTARADFEEMTRTCQALLGGESAENVLPLHLPVYGPAAADGHRPATGLMELL